MHLVDYTHPQRVPALKLPLDRRSAAYYLRLDELPPDHAYYARDWAIFRHPEWLEGGSAWLQATYIAEDLVRLAKERQDSGELRPVVGSHDCAFDEALAQTLRILGYRPMVAEVLPRARPASPAAKE